MCHERERFIDYLYGEADPDERARVGRHLEDCEECRAELGGLKRVREDLLAWDVPAYDSVWKPFAPVAARPWWREVPAWAMAAAATLTFAVGAAGSLVTHAMVDAEAALADPPPVVVAPGEPAEAELERVVAGLRQDVERLRVELAAQEARTEAVSADVASAGARSDQAYGQVLDLLNVMNTSVGSNAGEISKLRREWANYVAMQSGLGKN